MATIRRSSCPVTLRYCWDAIASIKYQRQVPTAERIAHFLQRKNATIEDVEEQLRFALKDDLVKISHKVGNKGSMIGVEQESYVLPEPSSVEKDSHDWYCFECHRSGEVLCCDTCFRVYHPLCVAKEHAGDGGGTGRFICPICKMLKSSVTLKLKKDELNVLLSYTCNRLKEKASEDARYKMKTKKTSGRSSPDELQELCDLCTIELPDEEDEWQYEALVYKHMDLVAMEDKALTKEYRRLDEFKADALVIVHNIIVLYGLNSPMASLANQMLQDCLYDLGEIQLCHDCYRMSNEKREKSWFCQPCNPPHELVYAKQLGYPFWPAKVIRKTDDMYDVRFFGTLHQRANVTKNNIQPITVCPSTFRVKRTSAWIRALDELKRHQQLLGKCQPSERRGSEAESEDEKPKPKKANIVKGKKGKNIRNNKKATKMAAVESQSEEKHNVESSPSSPMQQPTTPQIKQVPTPEDYNVVSSSSQEPLLVSSSSQEPVLVLTMSIGTQTLKFSNDEKQESKEIQTGSDLSQTSADELVNEDFAVKDLTSKLKATHKADKEKALQKLTEKLEKKHSEDLEKAVAEAVSKVREEMKNRELKEEVWQREIKTLNERHRELLSEAKKKQWCYNCEVEAIYHCCWNTSYCSVECQQLHWQKEHKRTCRRKR